MNPEPTATRASHENPDPITGAPGSHPAGTGFGAATAAAVAGGLGGKAMAELFDPTAEEAYWREAHSKQPYAATGKSFEDYAAAYRSGYEAVDPNAETQVFETVKPHIRQRYEQTRASLAWTDAEAAAQAAWERAYGMSKSRAGLRPPVEAV